MSAQVADTPSTTKEAVWFVWFVCFVEFAFGLCVAAVVGLLVAPLALVGAAVVGVGVLDADPSPAVAAAVVGLAVGAAAGGAVVGADAQLAALQLLAQRQAYVQHAPRKNSQFVPLRM